MPAGNLGRTLMPREENQSKRQARQRASKACQRCSNRKVKCDATQVGLPCTRCRLDGIDQCVFIASRRGTYDRGVLQSQRSSNQAHASTEVQNTSRDAQDALDLVTQGNPPPQTHTDILPDSTSHIVQDGPSAAAAAPSKSLTSMFEEFLKDQGWGTEEHVGRYGIVLLGDSSPLTYAFNELSVSQGKKLHDGTAAVSEEPRQSIVQRKKHPSHLSEADIIYLQAKGAFDLPEAALCYALFDAFINHHYPFYSIFDKEKIKMQHRSLSMPYILLHSISMIGASYCSIGVIQEAGFTSREKCRRSFYEKAKVLYDVGYETNRLVLLQALVLLTFWGPDMNCYWNPCSWIGVAVTIAESLGIHRLCGTNAERTKEGKLLRRLWWMVTIRDVYCASLLGCPFRVNLTHCGAPLLTMADFEDTTDGQLTGADQLAALYQIQILNLSCIMRQIVNMKYNAGLSSTAPEQYQQLEKWQKALPLSLNWAASTWTSNIFGESLKILFHHNLIFLYMASPSAPPAAENSSLEQEADAAGALVAEHAAHMIASTSLTLVTQSLVRSMPQEVYAGYFVAGIVFFRMLRRQSYLTAQLARSAFDNCRTMLKQVRDSWDSALWGLRVFDFLETATMAQVNAAQSDSAHDQTATSEIRIDMVQSDPSLFPDLPFSNSNNHFDSMFLADSSTDMQSAEYPTLMPMWTFDR